jgi:DNA-binding GntR family transcriptional regulator
MPVEAEFERIAREITDAILDGQFQPDSYGRTWLPTQKELAVCFGFSTSTVQTALRLLADRGVIIRRQGKEAQVDPEWLACASRASTEGPSPNGRQPDEAVVDLRTTEPDRRR